MEQVSARYLQEYRQSQQVVIKNWRERYFRLFEDTDGQQWVEDFVDVPENRLNPFPNFEAKSVRTRVFFMRVFLGKSIDEVADALDISKDAVSNHFHFAKARAERILEALNTYDGAVVWAKNTPHKLTERETWFILYKIFGLTYKQIKQILPDVPVFKVFSRSMRAREKKYLNTCNR